MAINLEDKLFHSVVTNGDFFTTEKTRKEINLLKLKRIFLKEKIMCRKSIEDNYQDIPYSSYFSARNYNGNDLVSLVKHISQKDEEDFDKRYVLNNGEDAWQMYPFSHVSLVLNKNLLNENLKYPYGPRISSEIQVKGDISLKYLEAISFPGYTELYPFFCQTKIPYDYYLEAFLKSGGRSYQELREIITLMNEYNINLPLISIVSGEEYQPNKEYETVLNKLLKKVNFTHNY